MTADDPLLASQLVVRVCLCLVAAIAMFGGAVQFVLGQPDTSPRLDNVHRFMAGVYFSPPASSACGPQSPSDSKERWCICWRWACCSPGLGASCRSVVWECRSRPQSGWATWFPSWFCRLLSPSRTTPRTSGRSGRTARAKIESGSPMDIAKIPIGLAPPQDINVIIEIPQGGEPIKYEIDKESGALRVDRFLHTSMCYPGNYGFIPHTLCATAILRRAGRGSVPVVPGAVVRSRPIGALLMEDEAGGDEKIIAVPVDTLHPFYKSAQLRGSAAYPVRADRAFLQPLQGSRARQMGQGGALGRSRGSARPGARGDRPRPGARDLSGAPDLPRLLDIMARLRDPERGCPWDLEQSFATIAPYTIEEAYEVADAIERGDMADAEGRARRSPLPGRVPCAHGRGGRRVRLRRRRPRHRRQDGAPASACLRRRADRRRGGADDRLGGAKAAERRAKAAAAGSRQARSTASALALPALTRAVKLQRRAARVGFDWPDAAPSPRQDRRGDRRAATTSSMAATRRSASRDEVGDLLFAVANLARRARDRSGAGAARRHAASSSAASAAVEALLAAAGRSTEAASLEEMERLWLQAKKEES